MSVSQVQSSSTMGINSYLANKNQKEGEKKNNINIKLDNSEKVMLSLAAIGTIAVGAVLAARGKINVAKEVVKNSADDVAKKAEQAAKAGVESLQNGANYSVTRKEATKNLTHDGKKIVKKALSSARKENLNLANTAKQEIKNEALAVKKAPNAINNVGQGIKNATKEAVEEKISTSQNISKEAKDIAASLKEKAVNNTTHKNIMNAQRAENKAIKAQQEAKKLEEAGKSRIKALEEKAQTKAQNIEQMKNSMTPEKYAEAQNKMANNAIKTQENAAKRKLERAKNKAGGYNHTMNKLRNVPKARLESIVNSKKSSEVEKQVASDLLSKLA